MEQPNHVEFCEHDKESGGTKGPIQSYWYLEDTKRIFLSEEKFLFDTRLEISIKIKIFVYNCKFFVPFERMF